MENLAAMATAMADRSWMSSPASGLGLGDLGVQSSARGKIFGRSCWSPPVCTPTYTAALFPPFQGLQCKL